MGGIAPNLLPLLCEYEYEYAYEQGRPIAGSLRPVPVRAGVGPTALGSSPDVGSTREGRGTLAQRRKEGTQARDARPKDGAPVPRHTPWSRGVIPHGAGANGSHGALGARVGGRTRLARVSSHPRLDGRSPAKTAIISGDPCPMHAGAPPPTRIETRCWLPRRRRSGSTGSSSMPRRPRSPCSRTRSTTA